MKKQEEWAEVRAGAEAFVKSELFVKTFREGMALVEETADYLDGPGRAASKALPRAGALAYAGASMRLTTQLMQIASWLLVLRAVREGDMAIKEAREDKYRLKACAKPLGNLNDEGVPADLAKLAESAGQLYQRIVRLDVELFTDNVAAISGSDAAAQQRSLAQAFKG